jgi:hypothetical protein
MNKYTKALLQASREVDLEVNTEKTMYLIVSRKQNAGKCHNFLTANKQFGNVAKALFWNIKWELKCLYRMCSW